MPASFTAEARDSLSNLAASLNAGRDKVLGDAFFIFDLDRSQVEAMYRGDWLARKIVDIVPYDMVREWRVRAPVFRLDVLLLRSAGVDPAALGFEFRPLWQMDAAASATVALQKARPLRTHGETI